MSGTSSSAPANGVVVSSCSNQSANGVVVSSYSNQSANGMVVSSCSNQSANGVVVSSCSVCRIEHKTSFAANQKVYPMWWSIDHK